MNQKRISAVANVLKNIFDSGEFAGKKQGKYSMDRNQLRMMLGVPHITPTVFEALNAELFTRKFTVIDMDDHYAVCESDYLLRWRKLSNKLGDEFVNQLNAEFSTDE